MRYLVVVHNWFMSSKGFQVHDIEATDDEDAYKQGLVIKAQGEDTFNQRAIKVIGIDKDDSPRTIGRPTVLSRLIGKFK